MTEINFDMVSDQQVGSALLHRLPVAFMVILAAVSTVRNVHRTALHPRDDSPTVVAKFTALGRELPEGATVCYLPKPQTAEELRRFQLAQYALSPRILVLEDKECRWTIGPDFHVR